MQTLSYAYHDAISGVRGKAKDYEILPNDANDDKLIAYIQDKESFCIISDGQEEDAMYLKNFLETYGNGIREVTKQEAELVFHLCPYIFYVEDFSREEIYIDGERNCIITEEDVNTVKNYRYSKLLHIYMNQGVLLAQARKMREEMENGNEK